MENLKLAKIVLYIGIVLGGSIPFVVITNQGIASTRRKEGIMKDQERIRKKLEENPNLVYRTEASVLPITEDDLDTI